MYLILGVLIGFFARFLIVIIKDKIEERNDRYE